jgi:hypothetical protein
VDIINGPPLECYDNITLPIKIVIVLFHISGRPEVNGRFINGKILKRYSITRLRNFGRGKNWMLLLWNWRFISGLALLGPGELFSGEICFNVWKRFHSFNGNHCPILVISLLIFLARRACKNRPFTLLRRNGALKNTQYF